MNLNIGNINLLEIIVLIIVIIFAAAGFRKGFIRKLSAMLSLVLSIVLVSAVLPYITQYLKENTPVYEYIVDQCTGLIGKQVTQSILSSSTSGSGDTAGSVTDYQNLSREQIKALMEQNGYDSAIVDTLSDEQLEQYKRQYAEQYVEQYLGGSSSESGSSGSESEQSGLNGLTRIEQTELIEELPLPQMLKDILLDYNNEEGYSGLHVSTFSDYLINFIATNVMNLLAFLISVVLVHLILRIIFHVLNFAAQLPVIRGINRIAGMLLGILQSLILLWLLFLILSMFSGMPAGQQILTMVQQSAVLRQLYDANLFLPAVVRTAVIFS